MSNLKDQDLAELETRLKAMGFGKKKDAPGGNDPHRAKAAKIFNVPESKVTPDQRKVGKLRNFQEMYGSPFGRARK